ncbi:hypothetical protein BC830DRAFT_1165402 [Chytriomyces sp. MP71]|nr:hypothetical protein BC830DRAFT_1165402 [Chytriomyces sp. MP71]
MTTCSAVQTEPERFNSLVSSSPLSTASVLLQEPIPATPTNTVIPPDFHNSLHDDDDKDTLASDTSWETLTPSEFEALRDQWWHDFRFAEDLEPLDSPLKESRCRTGAGSPRPAATTRRRPLVTRIARPLYFDGLPWSTVEPVFIGPLGSECPARVGLVGVGTAGARAVGVARRSVDDAGERISRMPGRAWSKWRSFRDAKTRQVHRELILDRIDRAEHVNNEKDVEEAQEKEIVLVIEAGGDIDGGEGKTTGQDPWRDWAAMVRAHAIQGKSKENGPRQAFSSTLCEMRREEAIVEGVLYDLEKRHSKVRATRAIERRAFGANPIVHPGVVGTEYLRRVWDEAQIEQPEEEKEMK